MSLLRGCFVLVVVLCLGSAVANADIFIGAGFNLVDASGPDPQNPGVASGDIVVSGNGGTIALFNSVTLSSLSHTWVGDLEIKLTNVNSGASVFITSPPDDRNANLNGTYTFLVNPALQTLDEATIGLNTAATTNILIAPGNYAMSEYGSGPPTFTNGPRTTFSPFNNLAIDGTWRLTITDFSSPDSGTLGGWSFNANITAVPEPTSFILLGFVASAIGVYRLRRKQR